MPIRQEEIINAFVSIIKNESDVKSCFLSGSFALGRGDTLSDIDMTIVTSNGKADHWFSTLQPIIEGIGPTLIPLRTETSKRSAIFVFTDLIEISVTVFDVQELRPSPVFEQIKPLLDPEGNAQELKDKSIGLPKHARIEALIATESLFLWGALAVRKRLLRDNVWDARDALEKIRYLIVRLINLKDGNLQGYRNIEKYLDNKTVLLLSKTAAPYDKDAVLSALAACFDLFVRVRDEVFAKYDVQTNSKATGAVESALKSFR